MDVIDNPTTKEFIYAQSEPLREHLDDRVQWQWDKYHQALLAEFSVDHEQPVYLSMKQHFPHVWHRKNIKTATQYLRHRAGYFGELKKDQQLLTVDVTGDAELMAAWWPWGHGATISVRLFRANTSEYTPSSGLSALFKRWF